MSQPSRESVSVTERMILCAGPKSKPSTVLSPSTIGLGTTNVSNPRTMLDMRHRLCYMENNLAHRGRLSRGHFRKTELRCGARARMNAIRPRAALGHRSTGTRTGPRGVRLTAAYGERQNQWRKPKRRRRAKHLSLCLSRETRFWG